MAYIVKTSTMKIHCPIMEQRPNIANVAYYGVPSDSLYLYHLGRGEKLPDEIVQMSSHDSLPDFIVNANSWIVSEAFRKVLNQVGQGKNEFLPVPVYGKNGAPSDQEYYLLDVREIRQAINFDQSRGRWDESYGVRSFEPEFPYYLPINPDVVNGVHLWREPKFVYDWIFFSDELVAAVERAKLKRLRYEALHLFAI